MRTVMLYDAYLEATRKVIRKCVLAPNPIAKAEASLELAMLRVNYYEQFENEYSEHCESGQFIRHQINNCWQLVGAVRDQCDEVGFDWISYKAPDLTTYINEKPQ